MNKIDGLPDDALVIVTGDFNVRQTAPSDGECVNEGLHPVQYRLMRRTFVERGFFHAAGSGNDHVFIRDPQSVLKGASSEVLRDTVQLYYGGPSRLVSDHAFIRTDLKLTGSGLSPPLLWTVLATL